MFILTGMYTASAFIGEVHTPTTPKYAWLNSGEGQGHI